MTLIKQSLNVFVKSATGIFISFFLVLSLMFIVTVLNTKSEGYIVYEYGDNGRAVLYEHNYSDGEDTLYSEYVDAGKKLEKVEKRSALSDSDRSATYIYSQIASLIICTMIIYTEVWKTGNLDYNAVLFGRKSKNTLNGLYVGLLADIPSIAIYLLIFVCRANILKPNYLPLYRILNSHFYGFTYFVYGNTVNVTELNALQVLLLAVPVLFIPVVTAVAYVMGFKDISLKENFIYRKKRKENI